MLFVVAATRLARRTLDVLLVLQVVLVLGTVVLARVAPAVTGGTTFVVGGGSMEPTIPVGAAVMPVPVDPGDLRVGHVVSVRAGTQQAVFTHRIVRLVERDDGLWLATRGDANAEPDPSIVPASSVIGRVHWMLPYAGYLVALLSSINGVVFLVSIAGFLLAGAWILETLEDDQRDAIRRRARGGHPSRAPEPVAGPGVAGS